jgi:hypothetical protein
MDLKSCLLFGGILLSPKPIKILFIIRRLSASLGKEALEGELEIMDKLEDVYFPKKTDGGGTQ